MNNIILFLNLVDSQHPFNQVEIYLSLLVKNFYFLLYLYFL